MTLARRIIPTVLCRGRQMVKGQRFNAWRSVGLAEQAMRIHAMRGVDELMLLDIAATAEGRGPDLKLVESLSQSCFTPLTVGGGIRTLGDVKNLLAAGADKVAICSLALEEYRTLKGIAKYVGSQAVVGVVDCRGRSVCSRSGTIEHRLLSPAGWAYTLQELGAGEILLQAVDRDGTMEGYDLDTIRAVSDAVDIPVIASGGCKGYEDMARALEAGASGVAAGALFQFTDATPAGAAAYLKGMGIEVRV